VAAHALEEHLVDRSPRRVGSMVDAADRMPALAGQVQAERSLGIGRERHALSDEPFDRLGALLGDEASRSSSFRSCS
jgi:hypothetical protein